MDRELLDAEAIAGSLVPDGSVFAFLASHRHELFPDEFTADLFASRTGRPSLPADLVGAVLVLKELYDLSDPQTADALRNDIRWKAACGRSLTQMSFDPSTLVYWRRRIAASDRPDRVFDAVAEVIAQTGILRGRRKRCVDSTVFDDAVATQDTVTQMVAAIRKVARVVPGAGEVAAAVCKLDYSGPGKPPIDWDDPARGYPWRHVPPPWRPPRRAHGRPGPPVNRDPRVLVPRLPPPAHRSSARPGQLPDTLEDLPQGPAQIPYGWP